MRFIQRLKIRRLFNFSNWRMPGTPHSCVDRVPKAKKASQKAGFIHSYTLHRVKFILYAIIQVKQEQQQWNLDFLAHVLAPGVSTVVIKWFH
jgi:hypothetical protein